MPIDDPKKNGDKTITAGKKATREALIEAQIVALFQRGLADTTYKQYDALLRNEALRKSDPVKWVHAMSTVLDIPEAAYPPLMSPEETYLAELLALYIGHARATSYQMRIASGVAPKTPSDMAAHLRKLERDFAVLPLIPQKTEQEATPPSSAPKPANAVADSRPINDSKDEMQKNTNRPH